MSEIDVVVYNGRNWLFVASKSRNNIQQKANQINRKKTDYLVAAAFVAGVSPADVLSEGRNRDIAHVRMAAMIVARREGLIFKTIGEIFNRKHTTVLLAMRRFNAVSSQVELVERALAMMETERARLRKWETK